MSDINELQAEIVRLTVDRDNWRNQAQMLICDRARFPDAHVAVLTAAKLYADSGAGAMVEIKEVAA